MAIWLDITSEITLGRGKMKSASMWKYMEINYEIWQKRVPIKSVFLSVLCSQLDIPSCPVAMRSANYIFWVKGWYDLKEDWRKIKEKDELMLRDQKSDCRSAHQLAGWKPLALTALWGSTINAHSFEGITGKSHGDAQLSPADRILS